MGIITPAIGPNSSKKVTQYPWRSFNEKQQAVTNLFFHLAQSGKLGKKTACPNLPEA